MKQIKITGEDGAVYNDLPEKMAARLADKIASLGRYIEFQVFQSKAVTFRDWNTSTSEMDSRQEVTRAATSVSGFFHINSDENPYGVKICNPAVLIGGTPTGPKRAYQSIEFEANEIKRLDSKDPAQLSQIEFLLLHPYTKGNVGDQQDIRDYQVELIDTSQKAKQNINTRQIKSDGYAVVNGLTDELVAIEYFHAFGIPVPSRQKAQGDEGAYMDVLRDALGDFVDGGGAQQVVAFSKKKTPEQKARIDIRKAIELKVLSLRLGDGWFAENNTSPFLPLHQGITQEEEAMSELVRFLTTDEDRGKKFYTGMLDRTKLAASQKVRNETHLGPKKGKNPQQALNLDSPPRGDELNDEDPE